MRAHVVSTVSTTINTKKLRASLPEIVKRVGKGARFTVLYRSRPVFQIVPIKDARLGQGELARDPLYRAKPLGRSSDVRTSAEHDSLLYRS
jgi:antitoxin (DNA-binding transcriptional repressor) of toxin-antitoxin stability system